MTILSVKADHYRIPLGVTLSDATHGEMSSFEFVTVRLETDSGLEGVGFTYTTGAGGAAIRSLIERELMPVLVDSDEGRTEQLWQQMWWRLHYAGRGGPASFAISAVDIALWDLKARRHELPLWRFLGGHNPRVPAYAGGIDLQFPMDQLRRQTESNLEKGFRAIKMKVGRPRLSEDLERVEAMRAMLGNDIPLMVDANMRWSADEAIRAARAMAEFDVFWGNYFQSGSQFGLKVQKARMRSTQETISLDMALMM